MFGVLPSSNYLQMIFVGDSGSPVRMSPNCSSCDCSIANIFLRTQVCIVVACLLNRDIASFLV